VGKQEGQPIWELGHLSSFPSIPRQVQNLGIPCLP
jgi:hypothetical protein